MNRCIELAEKGLPDSMPNPSVGAVLVYKDRIISEGFTSAYGGPHAEVNAINKVREVELLNESTLYVSLEPCSHFGKTPPCSDLIISSGIKKVVVGCTDPNPKVAGNGIKKLIASGCEVIVGVLAEDCERVNKRFFTYYIKKRPYIILKWAQTQDGFIAPLEASRGTEKKPVWITNEFSRQLVHKVRSEEQAILVGTTTALIDNPSLTTRHWSGKSPVRVVIDKELKISKDANVMDGTIKTIIITEKEASERKNLIFEKVEFSNPLVPQICDILYRHQLQSVIVEGGAKTLQTFMDANIWDEAIVFTSTTSFGKGVPAPQFSGKLISDRIPPNASAMEQMKIKNDTLQHFKNTAY